MTSASNTHFCQTEDGRARIQVRFKGGTLWHSQAQMVELFQTPQVKHHPSSPHIFAEGELTAEAVIKYHLTTAADSKQHEVAFYYLDVIIAVGYRVRPQRGTQFRQWATSDLREYVVKAFLLDDDRLTNLGPFGGDYFDGLQKRIDTSASSLGRYDYPCIPYYRV